MSRPATFGSKIYTNSNGVQVISLGIGVFEEHVMHSDLRKHVGYINSCVDNNEEFNAGMEGLKQSMKLVPAEYRSLLISPTVHFLVKTVNIRNSDEVKQKYRNFLLEEGKYELFALGTNRYVANKHRYLGRKRIFTEKDLLFMEDYQSSLNSNMGKPDLVSAWSRNTTLDGFYFLVKEHLHDVISDVLYSLNCGLLAMVDGNYSNSILGLGLVLFGTDVRARKG